MGVGFKNRDEQMRGMRAIRTFEKGEFKPAPHGGIAGLVVRPGIIYSKNSAYRFAVPTWYDPATGSYRDVKDVTVLIRSHDSATPPLQGIAVFATISGQLDNYAVYMAVHVPSLSGPSGPGGLNTVKWRAPLNLCDGTCILVEYSLTGPDLTLGVNIDLPADACGPA